MGILDGLLILHNKSIKKVIIHTDKKAVDTLRDKEITDSRINVIKKIKRIMRAK